jgi:hypothetical protein
VIEVDGRVTMNVSRNSDHGWARSSRLRAVIEVVPQQKTPAASKRGVRRRSLGAPEEAGLDFSRRAVRYLAPEDAIRDPFARDQPAVSGALQAVTNADTPGVGWAPGREGNATPVALCSTMVSLHDDLQGSVRWWDRWPSRGHPGLRNRRLVRRRFLFSLGGRFARER